MAARDIRALPKLEGTVHVNIALIVKFIAPNYFFQLGGLPACAATGMTVAGMMFSCGTRERRRGLGQIRFNDFRARSRASTAECESLQRAGLPPTGIPGALATHDPTRRKQKDVRFPAGVRASCLPWSFNRAVDSGKMPAFTRTMSAMTLPEHILRLPGARLLEARPPAVLLEARAAQRGQNGDLSGACCDKPVADGGRFRSSLGSRCTP